MLLERFYHGGLAQASYMVACQASGEALVVDPHRRADLYLAAAERARVRIVAVAETHIHADFVSGARDLARRAGARLYLSGAGPAEWQYRGADGATLLRSGDRIALGRVVAEALHTPGHTPEHLVFLVTDSAVADQPVGMLSGDLIFAGDVGRPDLLDRVAGQAGTRYAAARQLYATLRATDRLADYLQIWPGHGAGSACGKALGAIPQTTLGYERRFSWAFQQPDAEAFCAGALSDQPTPPPYFARMKQVNRDGPAPLAEGAPAALGLAELAALRDGGAQLIDVRPSDRYAEGFVLGALNLPLGEMVTRWGGWLAEGARPYVLIADPAEAAEARAELALIGVDDCRGLATPADLAAWIAAGLPSGSFRRAPAAELEQLVAGGATVFDVRRPGEYAGGHLPGARNLPLGDLPALIAALEPAGGPLVVHCQGGGRSPVAAGMLAARGWGPIVEMRDGYLGWRGPVVR